MTELILHRELNSNFQRNSRCVLLISRASWRDVSERGNNLLRLDESCKSR